MARETRRAAGVLLGALALGALIGLAWLGGRGPGAAAPPPAAGAGPGGRERAALAQPGELPEASVESPRRAAEERPPPPMSAPAGEPFRGRLVDLATGEPVPQALLLAGRFGCPVGDDGRWRADGPLPEDVDYLEFHDPLHGSHIRTLARAELVADAAEGWLAPIAVGPTTRVRVLGAPGFQAEAYEARLVELRPNGTERAASFHPLRAADPPWFRYDNPWRDPVPGSAFRVDVRDRGGTCAGSSEPLPGPAVGIRPEVATVFVDRLLARVVGRVVDADGQPKEHATVQLVPLGDGGPADPESPRPATRSDGDGTFQLGNLRPGEYLLSARPRRGEAPCARRVELPPGTTVAGDLVVGAQVAAGMVEGRLESRAGRPLREPELVRLRAVGGGFELYDTSSPVEQMARAYRGYEPAPAKGAPAGAHLFEFNEAPAGELELSVVPQDGYTWTPASIRISAPDAQAVFVREDAVPHARFRLDVVDAGSGVPLPEYDLELDLGDAVPEVRRAGAGFDFEAPAGPWAWLVSAPGYRAGAGTERDFGPGDPRVAQVRLARGFSARISVRDFGAGFDFDDRAARAFALERPLLAGARILADGRLVATATDGTAWIELEREPEVLGLELAGFRPVESDRLRGGRLVGAGRDVTLWMARE